MADRDAGEKLACDIVMKGGITSGLVYPGAIAELAARYRFRAIGGTSAGAIPPAVVAAAGARRRPGRADPPGGFPRAQELPDALAVEHDGDLQLLRLFQPDPQTAGLFRVMTAFMK